MSILDYLIVLIPLFFVIFMAFYAKKYIRSVVDYLAAGRLAGRYLISVGDMAAGLSVITLVASSEQYYQTGFGLAFWNNITIPIGITLALSGYCLYRWRETQCLSKGQFIELRYGSKFFRVVTAFISTMSEMLVNAIGPAIATKFFIYYLGLPHKIMIGGIGLPCYGIIVVLCLIVALIIIWSGGRVSLLITDSIQGLFAYPIFVIIVGFIILKFGWDTDISPVLWNREANESFINPYDVSGLRDFNVFALIVTISSNIMNRASWIGNDTSNSGRTPHEQKMGGILGAWRNGVALVMMILIGIVVVVFMNSSNFATKANQFKISNNEIRRDLIKKVSDEVLTNEAQKNNLIHSIEQQPDIAHSTQDGLLSRNKNLDTYYLDNVRQSLGDTPEARADYQKIRTIYYQQMMPVVLNKIFPIGLTGLFCLLMVMLLISTDDTRIFNAAGCIVQDMILPFWKGHMSTITHLKILRVTSLAVALFFGIVSLFFAQLDYINMFTTIMSALWLGGAGPIMVFGLYTRFGNLTGAWCAIIFGSGTSLLGLIFQQNWTLTIYPWLEKMDLVSSMDNFLRLASSPFNPWISWQMDELKFPISSYEIFFISMILGIGGYIVGSLVTYKPYDLNKLLHRTEKPKERVDFSYKKLLNSIITITPDYTKGDKITAWAVFFYVVGYQFMISFVGVIIWNALSPWPDIYWDRYFYIVFLIVPGIVGVITTIWYMIGGYRDMIRLFKDLKQRVNTPLDSDNGQIER